MTLHLKILFAWAAALLAATGLLPAQDEAPAYAYPSPVFEQEWRLQWNDPAFVEAFIGSYEPLAEAEPKIKDKDEIELIQNLRELLTANPSAAAASLEQQISDDNSAVIFYILANLQLQSGELEKAAENYEKAIQKFENYRRAHKNLALVYLQLQETDKAAKHIHKALELGEKDGRMYGLLGFIYLNKENYLAAETAYREAILQQPEVQDWKLGLARSLLGMEQYAEANALFETLIIENPDKPDYWMLQVNTLLGLGQPERAVSNLEILRRMGKAKPPSIKLLGDIYMNMQMQDLAIDAYDELIANDNSGAYMDAALRIGQMLVQLQDYDRALTMLQKVENAYDNIEGDKQLKVLNLKAKIARVQGDRDLAIETLETIIKRDGLNGDALIELASLYLDDVDFSKINEAVDPEDADAVKENDRNTMNYLLAVEKYEMAAKIQGFEYKALVRHAQMLVKKKDYKGAVPLLKQALEYRDDPRIAQFLERVERAARNT